MWNYLKKVYHQDNDACLFRLEIVIVMFQHGSLSIQDYYSVFFTLWHEYTDFITTNVPDAALLTVPNLHKTSQRDKFLMNLRPEYESVRSSRLNGSLVPSLDIVLESYFVKNNVLVLKLFWSNMMSMNFVVNFHPFLHDFFMLNTFFKCKLWILHQI